MTAWLSACATSAVEYVDEGCDWATPARPTPSDAEYLIAGMDAGLLGRRFVEDVVSAAEIYDRRCE